jgi:hypothetical protein
MTTTEMHYTEPIQCMPWCSKADGHPNELHSLDQNCYSGRDYLYLPLNRRSTHPGDEMLDAAVGVAAKREVGFLPCVHVHLTMPDPDVDVGVKLTTTEARWLAAELLKTAELVEGAQ